MDIVLGMSMAPSNVRMVLMEGENADGVAVDQDAFAVDAGIGHAADQVVAAILGTRQSAAEGGYRLTSTGVTWSDQAQAAVLREALTDHKIENVMLVSAFLAAAALAQAVGSVTRYVRTGLLFIEPDAATLAVVDSDDGSIAELHRRSLSDDDAAAMVELTGMVADVDRLEALPDGVFVVGSGVDVAMIKPELEAASPLPVSVPEEPELALARGAALASANAPLFASATRAVAWAQDSGTGSLGYRGVPAVPVDYDATQDEGALAYSAVADDPDLVDSRMLDFSVDPTAPDDKPFLLTGSVLAGLFVVGVVALAMALAVNIRAQAPNKPNAGGNVVVPTRHVPAPPAAPKAPTPAPQPKQPPPPTAKPAPPPAAEPAPPPAAPAPPPAAPAPVLVPVPAPAPPPVVIPPLIPEIQIPGLPGGPPPRGPKGDRGDDGGWGGDGWGGDDDDHGRGRGGGHGPKIKIPLIPGVHIGLGF